MEIAFAPGGEVAYLMHGTGGTVTEVNAVTHEVVGTIQVSTESYLGDIVVSPDGRFFYTANGRGQFRHSSGLRPRLRLLYLGLRAHRSLGVVTLAHRVARAER